MLIPTDEAPVPEDRLDDPRVHPPIDPEVAVTVPVNDPLVATILPLIEALDAVRLPAVLTEKLDPMVICPPDSEAPVTEEPLMDPPVMYPPLTDPPVT